jgi:hypothetical protein
MSNSNNKSFAYCLLLFAIIGLTNCEKQKEKDKAQLIVDSCIVAHGGENYNHLKFSFAFRDKTYKIEKNEEKFNYQRIGKDSLGNEIIDIFTNEGLERTISGKKVQLADSMATKYKNSVNSVVYFALLPNPLNDNAVNKTYVGETTIGGQKYDKIKVTFNPENGGKDHEDVYIYWINQKTKLMDFFAYSYKVDGGGIRFRESIKAEIVNGIRIQNYINYAPIDSNYSLENLDKAYIDGKLQEFSRIENLNLKAN